MSDDVGLTSLENSAKTITRYRVNYLQVSVGQEPE